MLTFDFYRLLVPADSTIVEIDSLVGRVAGEIFDLIFGERAKSFNFGVATLGSVAFKMVGVVVNAIFDVKRHNGVNNIVGAIFATSKSLGARFDGEAANSEIEITTEVVKVGVVIGVVIVAI